MFRAPSTTDADVPVGEEGDELDEEEEGKNENVLKMAEILLTYGFFEKELGYVQGMSDLCAPLYVIMEGEEVGTFWCFVEWMERMVRASRCHFVFSGLLLTPFL